VTVYLIDGYNLLHEVLGTNHPRPGRGVSSGRQAGEPHVADLEEERRRLVDRVASLMGSSGDKAIIVFDSQRELLQKVESATPRVEVYFGSLAHSADAIIERQTYARSAGENVVLVTSDQTVQMTAFVRNVVRRSSRQFAGDLQEHTKKVANISNCITMGQKVEERVDSKTVERLKALRDELGGKPGEQREPEDASAGE
jgi:predicted RNA-binding protein with PIN domain